MDFFEWLNPNSQSWQEYNAAHPYAQAYGADTEKSQGLFYDMDSSDSFVNAMNTAKTWEREDMIRKEGYAREDNAYVNLFNQLKSMGINPALLVSSANPTVGSASGYSTSAFKTSNTGSTARTDAANSAKVAGSLIAALALIVAAFA